MSTSTTTAPRKRAATKAAPPKKAVAKKPAAPKPTTRKPAAKKIPAQRTSEVDNLGLRTEELVVAEHEARDERLFAALDWR